MLLAVAGLDNTALEKRIGILASGDWSTLPAHEQVGYHFARLLSSSPPSITAADRHWVEQAFGKDRALDVYFWACRCHYMTRVADGLQLPLEKENVFANP